MKVEGTARVAVGRFGQRGSLEQKQCLSVVATRQELLIFSSRLLFLLSAR